MADKIMNPDSCPDLSPVSRDKEPEWEVVCWTSGGDKLVCRQYFDTKAEAYQFAKDEQTEVTEIHGPDGYYDHF